MKDDNIDFCAPMGKYHVTDTGCYSKQVRSGDKSKTLYSTILMTLWKFRTSPVSSLLFSMQ